MLVLLSTGLLVCGFQNLDLVGYIGRLPFSGKDGHIYQLIARGEQLLSNPYLLPPLLGVFSIGQE